MGLTDFIFRQKQDKKKVENVVISTPQTPPAVAIVEKQKDARANYDFDAEDREFSLEKRRLAAERRKLQHQIEVLELRAQLKELKDEMSDTESNAPSGGSFEDTLMLKFLDLIMQRKDQSSAAATPEIFTNSFPRAAVTAVNPIIGPTAAPLPQDEEGDIELQTVTDDEIRAFIKSQNQEHIKMAKMMPENVLKATIQDKLPLTDECAARAAKILKAEF